MHLDAREVGLGDGRRAVLRSIEPGDAGAFRAYLYALAQSTNQIVTQPHEVEAVEHFRDRFERVRSERGELWVVAEAGGVIVGDCSLRVRERQSLAHNGIVGIGVAEGWRGVGLGRAMLGTTIEWARAHEVLERVELSVLHTNRAGMRLYQSFGFVREGVQARRIRQPDGTYADEVLMAVRVDG